MTTGEKIAKLRKEYNYTQEQLAQLLGVSRQSISKYESDIAYPETDKLIRLGEIFDCSLDYLLKDNVEERSGNTVEDAYIKANAEALVKESIKRLTTFEKKSKKTIKGLPLWHVGKHAVGITARGVISIGLCSIGCISLGVVSLGLFAIGAFALGIIALGSLAAGAFVCGGVGAGILVLGGLAAGDFAFGGLVVGDYFAYGDMARGMFAIGATDAVGFCFEHLGELSPETKQEMIQMMYKEIPVIYHWIIGIISNIL